MTPVDCAELHADGRCELLPEGGKLALWVAGPPLALTCAVDGAPRAVESVAAGAGGFTVRIALSAGSREVTCKGERVEGRTSVVAGHGPEAIARARSLRREHKFDEAEALVRPLLDAPDPAIAAQARGLVARLALSRDDIPRAVTELRRAVAQAEAAGLLTTAAVDRIALGDTLHRRQNALGEARTALEGVDPRVLGHRPWAEYQLGMIAAATGDARVALERLGTARAQARALGLIDLALTAGDLVATVVSALGRHDEALALIEHNEPAPDADQCDVATHLQNLGWVRYTAAAAGVRAFDDRASLEAVRLFETSCPSSWDRANTLLDIALARAARGEHAAALALLDGASKVSAPGYLVEAFQAELRAELLRNQGKNEAALSAYEALLSQGGGTAPLASRYRAELGRGRTLRALGRSRDALAAFDQAERLLEQQERLVPLGDAHGAFLSSRQEASVEAVDLWLAEGQPRQALAVARKARGRLLRALARWGRLARLDGATRGRWETSLGAFRAARQAADDHAAAALLVPVDERGAHAAEGARLAAEVQRAFDVAMAVVGDLPRTDLPPLAEGEALLTVHPLREGWAVFAALGDEVRVARLTKLDAGDPRALAEALLAPHADLLSRARLLRVLSGGALDEVNVHALPFGDGVLLDALPVVYGLDLSPEAPHHLAAGEASLVVSDPRGDLPLAASEARFVTQALAARSSLTLLARGQADLATLLARLPNAHWFHYAGHALLSREGMLHSALSLADGSSLEVGDVLALSRAPETVVLSACESARTFANGPRPGAFASLGLAQAFVLAGSSAVLATSARVPDVVASALAEVLYGPGFDGTLDARSVQRALVSLRATHPEHWALVRLVVP